MWSGDNIHTAARLGFIIRFGGEKEMLRKLFVVTGLIGLLLLASCESRKEVVCRDTIETASRSE